MKDNVTNQTEEKAAEQAVSQSPAVTAEQLSRMFAGYADNVRRQILALRSKDKIVSNLTAEVEKYRDDFVFRLLKPFCVGLISYLEDCKKTLRSLDSYVKDVPTVLKYASYVRDDLYDLLANEGVELEGTEFIYRGKPLFGQRAIAPQHVAPAKAEEVPAESAEMPVEAAEVPLETAELPAEGTPAEAEIAAAEEPADPTEEMLRIARENSEKLIAILAEREERDKVLLSYEEKLGSIEEDYSDAILLPYLRKLARAYADVSQAVDEIKEEITEENMREEYASVISLAIEAAQLLLDTAGVIIAEDVGDTYDIKTNRLMKMVPTEDETFDKKVAFRYTAAYLYEGKLLYPSRVDVYKYTPKN